MIKIVSTALVLATVVIVSAFCAIKVNAQEAALTYQDAMRKCGTEWRNSDARKSVEKGKGREAWQTFRKECISRTPYQKKQQRTNERSA